MKLKLGLLQNLWEYQAYKAVQLDKRICICVLFHFTLFTKPHRFKTWSNSCRKLWHFDLNFSQQTEECLSLSGQTIQIQTLPVIVSYWKIGATTGHISARRHGCCIVLQELYRDTKSQNFPVGRISRAKTFRTECVNRFCDTYAAKVRKSLSRHICAKSA